MFLKLYLLGAALALMPLLIQPDEDHRKKLFPLVPEDINGTTFLTDLRPTIFSNIVLIKCPYIKYRHKPSNYTFTPDDDILISENIFRDTENVFAWIPLLRQSTNQTRITCGRVNIKIGEEPKIEKQWIFNVIWNKSLIHNVEVEPRDVHTHISRTHTKCTHLEGKSVILSKKKENDVILKVNPDNIEHPYVNQLFYYFVIPENGGIDMLKKPCVILKAYNECPKIILKKHTINTPSNGGNNTNIVKVNGIVEKIDVILKLNDDTNYYRDEEISLSRMKYKDGEPDIIEDSKINSHFFIKGYDLVKLTYNCFFGGIFKNISEKYYFAPLSKDHIIKVNTIKYFKNETSKKPNCPIFYLNVGYLKKINYNGTEGNYQTLESIDGIKGNFNRTESHIFFKENEDGKTTLSCTYKTLDGTIKTTTNFVNEDTIAHLKDLENQIILNEKIQINETANSKVTAMQQALKEKEERMEKTIHEKEKRLKESNMSLFQKLSDKVGKGNAIFLVAALILFILIILAVLIVFVYKKWLSPYLIMLKQKRKYPNVYVFWDTLTSQPFDNYCKAIKEKKYLSNKVLNQIVVKKMEGGEEVDVGVSHLFDQTLVKCYRRFPRKIKAHYIYTDIEKRKYILSDGLTKDTQSTFWQMVYEEDIGTIVAIIYDTKSLDADEYPDDVYWKWKTKKRVFGKVIVTRLEEIKVNALFVTGQKILLEKDGGETKNLEIYHVSNWKENDIPQSDLQFVNMYQEIIKDSQKKNILIHSPEGTGARVYMFTYFACIYDALKTDNDTDCPLKIIKMMREQRYGGNIVPYEFAYVIKALVTNFFNNKILVDFSSRRADFYSSYDTYFYDYLRRQAKMDENVKKFLDFVNIVDEGKIYEYKSVFDTLGRMDPDILPEYSKRFQNAVKNHKEGKDKKRFRYSDIPCIDANGITINGKPEDDKESFIHANKFEYKTVNGTRKLILCQAPTEETSDDMLDMILRYKVSLIVILVKPEEANGPQKKWVPYYPTKHYELDTPNFTLSRIMLNKLDENFIVESRYQVRSKKTNEAVAFNILHYQAWPDTSIPSEHKSVYGLYKKIVSLRTDDYVAIHCSAGIGRTGTLALIMYLIDTINYFPTFDPITRLKCLREHRYLAIQKHNQFVFALLVVFEHYKKEIDEMDDGAYERFLAIAENLFNKEKKRQEKTKE
uniref:Tyrosine-protein phosphatase domain-containing protein n=1 Tax=Strongyloides papillosus TaxID=174720 RepID=A0A0N5BKT6_STREA